MTTLATMDEDGNEKNDPKHRTDFERKLKDFLEKYPGHVQSGVKVKMISVWDIVGALRMPGVLDTVVPDLSFAVLQREHYAFHDQGLPCIVENAYHALPLDEHCMTSPRRCGLARSRSRK
jgi:hypothetical protein